MLTGQHTVRTALGCVLRFFLADTGRDAGGGWRPVSDCAFQHAYELSLFDPAGLAAGDLRPNAHRVQLALDAPTGPGSFLWSDGADAAGVMTTNGKAPEDCGLGVEEWRRGTGGAA
ncbi:hypothetical protein [Streptomyces buecherae]|uniref:Uncharacterized protein n=1 Tax=Streptomyces buecherae TaxID=2763006 RepID=A0A7H8N6T4_9ACTN|nr:hypothetical protein [Streptomyces buecherae]QKW50234.1 hypothetical protein HUT08_12555 [Streptomyces buecherae]